MHSIEHVKSTTNKLGHVLSDAGMIMKIRNLVVQLTLMIKETLILFVRQNCQWFFFFFDVRSIDDWCKIINE